MEKYIRVSDIAKVCDPYHDWDVPQMTADEVAGIVRCKDCKWWDTDWEPERHEGHFCPLTELFPKEDWFCAEGERRDDDDRNG